MTVNKKFNGSELTISVEGRLDTTTAPALETEIRSSISGLRTLIFDFSGLTYISSAGLRVLLSAQKTMNKQGRMVIRHANDAIRDIFDVTGFVDILNIEK